MNIKVFLAHMHGQIAMAVKCIVNMVLLQLKMAQEI